MFRSDIDGSLYWKKKTSVIFVLRKLIISPVNLAWHTKAALGAVRIHGLVTFGVSRRAIYLSAHACVCCNTLPL